MSVLGFAGGELGSTAELSNVSGISMETGIVHGGKYSYRVSNGGYGYLLFPAHGTAIYFRGYFWMVSGHTDYTQLMSLVDPALVGLAAIYLHAPATPALLQLNSNTQFWMGTTIFSEGNWHRLEVCYIPGGYCEVRVNGRQEIVRNDFVAANPVAGVAILASTPAAGNVIWDDLHVTEDGFPGAGYVIARQSRLGSAPFVNLTAPTYTAFTKTGPGSWIDICWADTPANAASNAASTAPNQTQTMLIEAVSGAPMAEKYGAQYITPQDAIYGAMVYVHAHRVGGSPEHYIVRANGGVLTRSGPFNWTTLDTFRGTEIFQATLAQLDAMEIGAARGASTAGSNLVVNDVWLMVSYTTTPVAMQHFTGFETGSLEEVGGAAGTVTIDTAQVRSGVYAAKLVGTQSYIYFHPKVMLESTAIWARGYVYLSALPAATITLCIAMDSTYNESSLCIMSDGRAQLVGTSASTATPTAAFVVGAWNYFEFYKRSSVPGASGAVAAWVNDQTISIPILEANGVTTRLYYGMRTSSITMWLDDLAISETGRIGPGRVLARQGIAGTPTDQAWNIGGGAGAINATWSNTPVNPATFAQASNVDTAQTMLVSPQANGGVFLNPRDTILACRVVASARYSTGGVIGGGPTALRYRVARSGMPALVKDTAIAIISTTTRLYSGDVFTTMLEHLNTIQIGARHGPASTGVGMIVDDIWLMVAYADLQVRDLPLPSIPAPVAIVEIQL